LCSFLTVPTYAQSVKVQTVIDNAGNIVYNTNSVLYVDGTKLRGPSGEEVFLKGFQADWNERMKKQGTSQQASNPYESWFTEADIQTMKANGANYVELHICRFNEVMPTKDVLDTSYFTDWVDVWVDWATDNEMYVSINIAGFKYSSSYNIPDWIWSSNYSTPSTKADWDEIIRDFFDTDEPKMGGSRASFVGAWEDIANRYKSNDYVLFNIMNEPLITVDLIDAATAQHLGETYSEFMEDVVDAIHATGAENIIIIDVPFVTSYPNYVSNIQPVDKSGIIWEQHLYMSSSYTFAQWCSALDTRLSRLVGTFAKPVIVGEYGFSPADYGKDTYPDTWLTILGNQATYMDGQNLCGRQYHQWGWLEGEYGDYVYNHFTSAESQNILNSFS